VLPQPCFILKTFSFRISEGDMSLNFCWSERADCLPVSFGALWAARRSALR